MDSNSKFKVIENMISLRESMLFSTLTATEIERVVAAVKEHDCKEGEVLVAQGDKQWSLYIIKSGSVQFKTGNRESKFKIEKREAGDQFGELGAFVDNYRAPYSVITLEPTKLLSIDRDDLYSVLQNNPTTTLKLLEILAGQVYESAQQLERVVSERGDENIKGDF
jgi:CRP-like cAMP-binding protein